MKKFGLITVIILTLLVAVFFVACNKKTEETPDTVTLVTSTGTVLCTVSKDGSASTDKIAYEYNGGNVYSWVAVVNGEKVRVINDEELERNDDEEIVALLLKSAKVVVYPEKYYTLLSIDGSTITQKAVIGEIPRALPVSQKGYAEFLGYYYLNSKDEKVSLTNENGNFASPWSVNVKSITLYADFRMEPIDVKLDYVISDVQNKNETSIPDYIYYGSKIDQYAFPLPTHAGYDFAGWYTEETAGVQIIDEKGSYKIDTFKSDTAKNIRFTINESEGDYDYEVILYARWIAKSFPVKYYNGVELVKEISVNYGGSIPNLEAPGQTNMTFMYWYSDDEGTAYDFSTKMSYYPLDLHGKWVDSRETCPNCGRIIEDQAPACIAFYCPNEECNMLLRGAVADHTFDEEVVVTPASCGIEGKAERTCKKCGEKEDVVLAPKEHSYKFKSSLPATCSSVGYTTYECEICLSTDIRYDDVIVDHVFNTSRVPATEFELGYTSNKCVICETFQNNYFDIKGNSFIAVSTKEQLYAAAKDTVGNYALMNDLDLEGSVWTPWGVDEDGNYTAYQGVFNGNGHYIKNYKISAAAYGERAYNTGVESIAVGFFAAVDGEVVDLHLYGTVNAEAIYAKNIYVGGFAGAIGKDAKITSVFVNGDVVLNRPDVTAGGNVKAGGFVGLLEGSVEGCYADTYANETTIVDGLKVCAYNYADVGGFAGEVAEGAFLLASSARSKMVVSSKVAESKVGGVVGVNKGYVVDTIAVSDMKATAALQSFAAGLVANNEGLLYRSYTFTTMESVGADEKQSFLDYTIAKNSGSTYMIYYARESSGTKFGQAYSRGDMDHDSDIARGEADVNLSLVLGYDGALFAKDATMIDGTIAPYSPKSYLGYFEEKARVYALDETYSTRDEYSLTDLDFSAVLKQMEGSLMSYELKGSYDLKYGSDTYRPKCKTVAGVDYFFGTFDGGDNTIRKFKLASGYNAFFKNNYGTVKNINLRFYYPVDKDYPQTYKMGIVENNYGSVEACWEDGNYRIRMKKGLQIFLGIFVCLIVFCIFYGIESYFLYDNEGGAFVYVSAILSLLVVGGAACLGFFLGSTRLSVYIAITMASIGLWPMFHSIYTFGDLCRSYYSKTDAFKVFPAMLLHIITVGAAIAYAVVALKFL